MTKKPKSSTDTLHEAPAQEFVREVEVADLKGQRAEFDVTATADECAALARRFGVDGISNLTAHIALTPFASGNKVALKARFSADVAQTCVVTLAPLTNRVEGEFFSEFVERAFADEASEIEFGVDDDEPPEPIVEGRLEYGELIAQNLGLAIDPFPRAPGAVFEAVSVGDDGSDDRQGAPKSNPFAVLERLKTQKN